MNEPQLKPCPFCGGAAEVRDGMAYMIATKAVTCSQCHVRTMPVMIDHPSFTAKGLDESTRYTVEDAVRIACAMWNRRKEGVT